MARYMVLGLVSGDVKEIVEKVQGALAVKFHVRDSVALGTYYFSGDPKGGGEQIEVIRNWNEEEQESVQDPPSMGILINFRNLATEDRRAELEKELRNLIPGLVLVSRSSAN